MKFGKKLLDQLHEPWAEHYLPYADLKKICLNISPDFATRESNQAEGQFVTALLQAIAEVNRFYAQQEAIYAKRVEELATKTSLE